MKLIQNLFILKTPNTKIGFCRTPHSYYEGVKHVSVSKELTIETSIFCNVLFWKNFKLCAPSLKILLYSF